jgi:16S rRNA processing protein RimM
MSDRSTQREASNPQYLLVGEILRPHGVAGELRMRVLTHYPERLGQLETVYLARDPESPNVTQHTIEHVRMHQGYALLTLSGVEDREQAELLRGLFVMIPTVEAIPLEEGEYYLYQVIGLNVQTHDGQALGKIVEVLETGANDVYVVQGGAYGEVLIPVTVETIVKTDLDSGVVIVKLPEGLLPSR